MLTLAADIEGELTELIAFSSKRRGKLLDVLGEQDFDQLDYLRLAEVRYVSIPTRMCYRLA